MKTNPIDFLYNRLAPVMAILSPNIPAEFDIVSDDNGGEIIRDQVYELIEIVAEKAPHGVIRRGQLYTVIVVSEVCGNAHDDPPPSITEHEGLNATQAIQKALEALYRLMIMDAAHKSEMERRRELYAHSRSFPDDGTRTPGRSIDF